MNSLVRVAAIAALTLAASNIASAQDGAFVSYGQFVAGLSAAQPGKFVGATNTGVASAADFLEMQAYLRRLYSGVHVGHSFMIGNVTVDCVPIAEQPGVRLRPGAEIPQPTPDTDANAGRAQGLDGSPDLFGNTRACAIGTIPMRRTTLEDATRFRTLKQFLGKSPDGTGHAPDPNSRPAARAGAHLHAIAYQYVNNFGSAATLNLWSPGIVAGLDAFSLAQLWVAGGSGATVQTAEAGWQVYPRKWTNIDAVLFIFYTPDNYTSGCYNLLCPGFVQTNRHVVLGGGFPAYSHPGVTPQVLLPVAYVFKSSKWWFSVNGAEVGYYPASVYHGGQNSRHATLVEFGGETYSHTTTWPKMGSGLAPRAFNEFTYVAFQENIGYQKTATALEIPNDLKTVNEAADCYGISEPGLIANRNMFFYFGGAGGSC